MGKSDIKKIKNIINQTRSSLKWKIIEYKISDYDAYTILSNNHMKTHEIYYPKIKYEIEAQHLITYLHELCHATLAEKVHNLFASGAFMPGSTSSNLSVVEVPYKIAVDWFADSLLHKLSPNHFKESLSQDLMASNLVMNQNAEKFWANINPYGTALVYAESKKWLKAEIVTNGVLEKIIDVFISVDPEKPTLNALELLINRLLAIQTSVQVKVIYHEEYESELFEIINLH